MATATAPVTIELRREKDTKNFVRFEATDEDAAIPNVYVDKGSDLAKAETIEITVTAR